MIFFLIWIICRWLKVAYCSTRVLVAYLILCYLWGRNRSRILTFIMIFNDYAVYLTPQNWGIHLYNICKIEGVSFFIIKFIIFYVVLLLHKFLTPHNFIRIYNICSKDKRCEWSNFHIPQTCHQFTLESNLAPNLSTDSLIVGSPLLTRYSIYVLNISRSSEFLYNLEMIPNQR